MRLLFVVMLTFAVAALGSVGCGKGKTGTATGGTGTGAGGGGGGGGDADTFKLTAKPAEDVEITQGKDQKVSLTVTRGKNFKEAVKVELKTDAKDVTLDPKTVNFDAATTEQSFKIVAGKTAAVGAFTVHVTGTGGGKTVELDVTGKIEKAE